MRRLFLVIFFTTTVSVPSYSTNPLCELYINNRIVGTNLYVKFYPVGAIFNGNPASGPTTYSLTSRTYIPGDEELNGCVRNRETNPELNKIRYLVGLDGYALANRNDILGERFFQIFPDTATQPSYEEKWLLLGHDASENEDIDGLFGYGLYVLEIHTYNGTYTDSVCSIPIDWMDFNYPYLSASGGKQDLTLRIHSLSPLYITFQWSSAPTQSEIPLFGPGSPPYNGGIQVYKQYHRKDDGGAWIGYNLNNENQPLRDFSLSNQLFRTYPLDGRDLISPDTIPKHVSPGLFNASLILDTNVTTLSSLNESPTNIAVSNKSFLKINGDDSLLLITPSSGYNNLIIEDSSYLILGGKIIVSNPNKITFKNKSFLTFLNQSAIVIEPGALLCNEGATIAGPVNIFYKKGTHMPCATVKDFILRDSAKIILLDSAELIIPDSCTIKLEDKESKIIMNPNSKIRFGVNSKLVLENGARIIANNATFTSTDTTKLWDGIYSSDLSFDTISKCKIINAKNGINLVDKSDETWSPHSVIITDCDFINKTSSYINNAVYAYNSDELLFRNNKVFGESTGGFFLRS